MRNIFFNTVLYLLFALCLFGTWGCGALSTLSEEPENTEASLSVDEESLVSLETLLETPTETSLTSEQLSTISGWMTEGVQQQREGDTARAAQTMEKIVALDPNHPTANFILGIHDVNTLLMDDAVRAEFNNVIALWKTQLQIDTVSQGDSILSHTDAIASGIVDNVLFVTASDNMALQKAIIALETHIPRLNSAIVRLQRMLASPSFNYHIVNDEFDIDYTVTREHVAGLYVALNVVRGVLDMGLAYDLQFKEGHYASPEAFFSENPTFLTLRSGGAAHMTRARVSFENAITAALLPNRYNFSEESKDTLRKVRRSLKGETISMPFSVQNNTKTQIISHEIAVNLGNFFNSPIPDFRAYMGIHASGVLDADDFPSGFDFTLGGLFPELNTYADWEHYNSFGLKLYNAETLANGQPINTGGMSMRKMGDLLIAIGGYAYPGEALAEVFRLNGTSQAESLGTIASGSYYWGQRIAALSGTHLYYSEGLSTCKIYDVSGDSLALIETLSLDENILDMHADNDVLYIVTNSKIIQYSLENPAQPTRVTSLSLGTSVEHWNIRAISFHSQTMSMMIRRWTWEMGYITEDRTYDLVSGASTVTPLSTGYERPLGGYVNGQPVMLTHSGEGLYDVVWESGEHATIEGNDLWEITIENGFLIVSHNDSNTFDVYDIRVPGTALLMGQYRSITSPLNEEAFLPTTTGMWIYTTKLQLQFLPY